MRRSKKIILISAALLAAFWPCARGNDSAASTAMGGIQLRREPRIAMLKERLTISDEKIAVEYEFLNESDYDIATEVAFPIPSYSVTFSAGGIRSFDDFKVWVEGKELKYQADVRAKLKGHDITQTLGRFNIDVASLGHFDESGEEDFSEDFRKLAKSQKDTLIAAGFFGQDDQLPEWDVEKTYHWRQIFPAHKVVHVRHQYEPGIGFSGVETRFLDAAERKKEVAAAKAMKRDDPDWPGTHYRIDLAQQIDTACVDPKMEKLLTRSWDSTASQQLRPDQSYAEMAWVDYILTTANSWKTPIRDFELIVEKPKRKDYQWYVSFCWDGPVKRIDVNRFSAKIKDFVPKNELHIAFFGVH